MKPSKFFLSLLSFTLLSAMARAGPGKPGAEPADKAKPVVNVYGPDDMLPYSPLEQPEATPEVEASPSPSPIPSPSPSVVTVVGGTIDNDPPQLSPIPQTPGSGTGNFNPIPIPAGKLGGAGGCTISGAGAANGVWLAFSLAALLPLAFGTRRN